MWATTAPAGGAAPGTAMVAANGSDAPPSGQLLGSLARCQEGPVLWS
jgi:hypothetical protein